MSLASSAARILQSPEIFSRLGPRALRPYQADVARAVAGCALQGGGHTITVMFARQMGKNEISAQLEAYLMTLFAGRGGTIVKAAPSFKPQIVSSILRLKEQLDAHPMTRNRWRSSFGYMFHLGRASTTFLSADVRANVVGATASLLLEIDEAQDVDPEKYDRDFRPMASSTNATTVLYGTAWSEDSLLERQRRHNLEHAPERHFEYDWTVLAELNPRYGRFVEGEIARLGANHPIIQTQYLLHTIADAGRLFSQGQLAALRGDHQRTRFPGIESFDDDAIYVAGVDVAGEDEQAADAQARLLHPKRDSTVVTIARVSRNSAGQPVAQIAEHIWWTGRDQVWQYDELLKLWEAWGFARVCVDASGIGRGLAEFVSRQRPERTEKVVFTAPSKSQLAYACLAMINTGRLTAFRDDNSPESREFWKEVRACRYQLRALEQLAWGVPATEGHDDFVTALMLCARAAETMIVPAAGVIVRAPPDEYAGEEW